MNKWNVYNKQMLTIYIEKKCKRILEEKGNQKTIKRNMFRKSRQKEVKKIGLRTNKV